MEETGIEPFEQPKRFPKIEKSENVNNITMANEILVSMEKYFPIEIIEISQPDIEIQIGTLFYEVGNIEMFNRYMKHSGGRNDLTLQQRYSKEVLVV